MPGRIMSCRERSRPVPYRGRFSPSQNSNYRVDEAERIHHVGGTAALVPPYENYNNLNTVLSFAGEAECAVFRPDRGSDPTMSPAGGG